MVCLHLKFPEVFCILSYRPKSEFSEVDEETGNVLSHTYTCTLYCIFLIKAQAPYDYKANPNKFFINVEVSCEFKFTMLLYNGKFLNFMKFFYFKMVLLSL